MLGASYANMSPWTSQSSGCRHGRFGDLRPGDRPSLTRVHRQFREFPVRGDRMDAGVREAVGSLDEA